MPLVGEDCRGSFGVSAVHSSQALWSASSIEMRGQTASLPEFEKNVLSADGLGTYFGSGEV